MRVDIDQHNNLRLREVFSGVLLETREGTQIGVCMRDDGNIHNNMEDT